MSLPTPTSDSVIVITGASAGIGTELARQLAERGHHLVLTARRAERLEQLADELRAAHGVTIHVIPADLSDDADRARFISEVKGLGKQVIGLCNNAGLGSFGQFAKLDKEREQQAVRVNVLAMHDLAGAFVGEMVQRGEGALLHTASIAAFQPLPGNATYAATKAFVYSFSEALHVELGGTGVSCTSLCPGPVPTEFGYEAGVGDVEERLPGFVYESPEKVARAGIEGMEKGKRTVIPGALPRALALGGRFAPRTVLLPAARLVTSNL